MDRRDALRAGGKLDLGHRGHRAARAVPQVIVQRIIEYGRVVVCDANRAAFALRMEAVAEQRNQYVEMPKLAHVLCMQQSMIRERRRGQQRMDRWRFELEADRSLRQRALEKLIRINCLRRARKPVDVIGHHRRRNNCGVEKRTAAEHTVRIGHAASQQQRRRSDRSPGNDVGARANRNSGRRRSRATRVHRGTIQRPDAVAAKRDSQCPRACDQRGTTFQCCGNRREQHRLLCIRRAAHTAIAEIAATPDVATNRGGVIAKFRGADGERRVVGIRRRGPRRDREPRFHLIEPRRKVIDAEARDAEGA